MMGKRSETVRQSASRFTRSVNIEHDLYRPESLDGYVVPSGVRRCLMRIAPARNAPLASRVWTLTGPYGTGKSAFALYAAKLLSPTKTAGTAEARSLLRASDPDLAAEVIARGRAPANLLPIAVSGAREPLGAAILRGLHAAVNGVKGRKATLLARKIGEKRDAAPATEQPSGGDLTPLFAETLDTLCNGTGPYAGLFLIIDELGKLLEYAATHSTTSDVFLLQSLAEFAARCEKPFLILTVLHQDFSVCLSKVRN